MDKVQAAVRVLVSAEVAHPEPLPPTQETTTPLLLDVISIEYVPAANVYESCVPSVNVRLSDTTGVLLSPPPPHAETVAQAMRLAIIDFMKLPFS